MIHFAKESLHFLPHVRQSDLDINVRSYPTYFNLFYNVFLKLVEKKLGSGASEYEIYFNYMLKYYPNHIIIRKLNWKNTCKLETDVNLDYISYHWYMRKEN